ncbi:hypothetical protein [Necropsobacter rosorum]|uniref:hypothetical protein n=1 Tax=Necropsobacter rosorum TaxID=908285 RepID=UPI000509C52E
MEQFKPQIDEFQNQKAQYLAEKKALDSLIEERTKTLNIIEALKNEIKQNTENARLNLDAKRAFSVDDFIEFKQANTELNARSEYYLALIEELDIKIYNKKEEIYFQRIKLNELRGNIFKQQTEILLTEFISQNKDKLTEIYQKIIFGNIVEGNSFIGGYKGSLEYAAKEYISNKILSGIQTNLPIDDIYSLPTFVKKDEIKTPTQKHKESFNHNPKGFEKLFNH